MSYYFSQIESVTNRLMRVRWAASVKYDNYCENLQLIELALSAIFEKME